jgi:phage FluMu protein gp41
MGRQRLETTDRRYVKVGEDEWWDTTGIELVPEHVVDAYMAANRVGIAVIEVPDEETPPTVH